MRCPSCGARNPEAADWCTQCYADLRRAPEEPSAPAPGDQGAAREADAGADAAASGGADVRAEDGAALRTGQGRFRTRGDELEWRCAVCGEWNPLGAGACVICGTAFGRTLGGGTEEEPLADVEPGTVVLASGLLPGAGHVLLGRTAHGITRAAFFLFCLVGGYLLLRSAAASGQSLLPAFPLLLGAVIVWAGSIYDALALTARQSELLSPRVLVWLVIGVVGLLLVSFIPGLLRVGQLGDGTQGDEPADAPVPVQTVTVTRPPAEDPTPATFPSPTPGVFPPVAPTPALTP